MYSEKFEQTYHEIAEAGNNLLQYLKNFRDERAKLGDDTKSLDSINSDISKALTALKYQQYKVAVIAAMKAGKSTFLNAIIGADLLASESEACTVCRTDIRPISSAATPKLLEYRATEAKPLVLKEGDAHALKHEFLHRTREIRRNQNSDYTTFFEIEHPIEAIINLSSLEGFTLVDTPGPNEWESVSFNTVELKKTALEVLRTCDVILFILDYSSFKDNTNQELLKELLDNRQEFLRENRGKIYFILNKVDRKSESDRPIEAVINDLKIALSGFGIPEPLVYSVSAWKGLLSKLIIADLALESHLKDFKKFFSSPYAMENEEGDMIIPSPKKIAPQALKDSGILEIEDSVIQTIVKNSGWNLLSDVLAKLSKAAKNIEDTFNTRISGWSMQIDALKEKVEEYKLRSDITQKKIQEVKSSVEAQKEVLIKSFKDGINEFAQQSKTIIADEIERIYRIQQKNANHYKGNNPLSYNRQIQSSKQPNLIENFFELTTGLIVERIPLVGQILKATLQEINLSIKKGQSLIDTIDIKALEIPKDDALTATVDYVLRFSHQEDAEKIQKKIQDFCGTQIQNWWLITQDTLVRSGTQIRQELIKQIQADIQAISDELSHYLGDSLQVELNINEIQFPGFEFEGIDTKIEARQKLITKVRKETRTSGGGWCHSPSVYQVDVPYEERKDYYEIDLKNIIYAITQKIDQEVIFKVQTLESVIDKQIKDDFKIAENQINDYINRFKNDFEQLLKERENTEVQTLEISDMLKQEKIKINDYKDKLSSIYFTLETWKPN